MGRAKKKKAAAPPPPNGFDVLDRMVERGVNAFVQAVGQRLERPPPEIDLPHDCVACGAPTGRVCFFCRQPFCPAHTEFHNDEGWAICARCINFMVASTKRVLDAGRAAAEQRGARAQRARHAAAGPASKPVGPMPWEVLGVPPTADAPTLRKAYHRLVLECHPDRHPNDPQKHQRFLEVSDAYRAMKEDLERRGAA